MSFAIICSNWAHSRFVFRHCLCNITNVTSKMQPKCKLYILQLILLRYLYILIFWGVLLNVFRHCLCNIMNVTSKMQPKFMLYILQLILLRYLYILIFLGVLLNVFRHCLCNITNVTSKYLFSITNTMHTIGVDKITLFKTT